MVGSATTQEAPPVEDDVGISRTNKHFPTLRNYDLPEDKISCVSYLRTGVADRVIADEAKRKRKLKAEEQSVSSTRSAAS